MLKKMVLLNNTVSYIAGVPQKSNDTYSLIGFLQTRFLHSTGTTSDATASQTFKCGWLRCSFIRAATPDEQCNPGKRRQDDAHAQTRLC